MRAFDIIGSVAIIQEKGKEARAMASRLLREHKNLKTVYARGKIHGRLRVPSLRFVAGEKSSETLYKENGCVMKLDVKTCYFSPRLGTDRMEIARKVKKGEKVLVMFSGIGPYGIVIAKHSRAKEVYCIEISKIASRYAQENAKLNRLKNVKIVQGDVKRIVPKLNVRFDRIVMARAQLKETFLKQAFMAVKKDGIIHFYDFIDEKDFPQASINKIKEEANKARKKVKVMAYKKVREIAPYKLHVRIDFRMA